ncbi:uncharacterized protein YciI [Streptacidiphilus sp. MAP12-16]|uniref:YciI family protein n=1 Tax=Streptacidiphilus sp. MAP12-16 TaxID=3156300 RepID=UPI0035145744
MYVVTLTYTAPLEQIDALVPAHREWLDRNYADGAFLASGAQIPRVGGVVLARAESRAALDAVLAGDPFRVGGVATYQVVEFTATKTAPELAFLKE